MDARPRTRFDTDVLVVGGGASGVATAVAAARQGLDVAPGERYGLCGAGAWLTTEHGSYGGVVTSGWHPALAFAQFDAHGAVDVSNPGAGGLIDIADNARRLVSTGTFTTIGLNTSFEGSRLDIKEEGRVKKLCQAGDEVTYSPARGVRERGQMALVTERAVCEYPPSDLTFTELAPSIDRPGRARARRVLHRSSTGGGCVQWTANCSGNVRKVTSYGSKLMPNHRADGGPAKPGRGGAVLSPAAPDRIDAGIDSIPAPLLRAPIRSRRRRCQLRYSAASECAS